MKRKLSRRLPIALLSLCLIMVMVLPVQALNSSARTITIFRIVGDYVTLSRGAGRASTPREDQRLSDGSVISTGENSNVYLRLDEDSILKMDQQSRVVVGSSRNRLSLTVQSGSALVNAGRQSEGQTLETRIGNTGLTVRGTMFTMGLSDGGGFNVVMLSGSGEVSGILLPAGFTMNVIDAGVEVEEGSEGLNFEVAELDIEQLDIFTLQSIADNREYLLEAGTITPAMIRAADRLIAEANRPSQAESRTWSDESDSYSPPVVTDPPIDPPIEPPPIENSQQPPRVGNYYEVGNITHLRWMSQNDISEMNFRLTANIDGVDFVIPQLDGIFIGNGTFAINVDIVTEGDAGLFGTITSNGVVRNLVVTGNVTGERNSVGVGIGGIAGINNGEILASSFTGSITLLDARANSGIGGLVGINSGRISGCSASIEIRATANPNNVGVGGLVGINNSLGTIAISAVSGEIRTDVSSVSFVVGINYGAAPYLTSYSVLIHPASFSFYLGFAGNSSGVCTPEEDAYTNEDYVKEPEVNEKDNDFEDEETIGKESDNEEDEDLNEPGVDIPVDEPADEGGVSDLDDEGIGEE